MSKTNRPWRGVALCLFGCLFSLTAVADDSHFPTLFSAEYKLNRGMLHFGNTQRLLTMDEQGQYIFETTTKASSLLAWVVKDTVFEQSIWSFKDEVVIPLHYTYSHTGGETKREVKMEFDWKEGKVTNTVNNDPWVMEIPTKTQDKHSLQFAIMRDLQHEKKQLSYQVADGGTLKTYEIEQLLNEVIETPLGSFETIKIRYIKGKRETYMWCAKKLGYFPVQIEYIEDDGSRYQAKLVKFDSDMVSLN